VNLDELELTGRARTHVIETREPRATLHPAAAAALRELAAAAREHGIEVGVVSSFRDFERQRLIWNAKYRGERPLLDRDALPLASPPEDPALRIATILIWSALPGASRHHWGSDLDLVDRAALPPGGSPRLVPAEFAADGVFAALDRWLETHMTRFGFFRPFATDRGGVQPEPWHLSFAPVSAPALAALTPARLRAALDAAELEGRELVLARLEELHARYVAAVDPPPPAALGYV
jgi:LAS superfamily LD-carboxypeptidase LdcB